MSQWRWFPAIAFSCLLSITAHAQCTIGVYQDPSADSSSQLDPPAAFEEFSVYVVLSTSDDVNAAAYRLEVSSGLGSSLLLVGTSYGPSGSGIGLVLPAGGSPAAAALTVGLGECAGGFGSPVLVTEYRFLRTAGFDEALLSIEPNEFESTSAPVYSTCAGVVRECPSTVSLLIKEAPKVPKSVSEVKSLYEDQ